MPTLGMRPQSKYCCSMSFIFYGIAGLGLADETLLDKNDTMSLTLLFSAAGSPLAAQQRPFATPPANFSLVEIPYERGKISGFAIAKCASLSSLTTRRGSI